MRQRQAGTGGLGVMRSARVASYLYLLTHTYYSLSLTKYAFALIRFILLGMNT